MIEADQRYVGLVSNVLFVFIMATFGAPFSHFFFFNDTATTEIYTRPYTLSLHDALPISRRPGRWPGGSTAWAFADEQRSEEHTSELQSHGLISYAVFCLKKKRRVSVSTYRGYNGWEIHYRSDPHSC